jgi:hypothetical protein
MGMVADPTALTYRVISQLAGHRPGATDMACPSCGPDRRSPVNQRRKVLRVWRVSPTFVTFRCARCDLHGYAREDGAPAPDPAALARAKAGAQRFAAETAEGKRRKAQWLWGRRQLIGGTPAERYLREVRHYSGPIPATIGFLPGRGDFTPAMISAFGMTSEIEPGVIAISPDAIQGLHLTRLTPDGSAKAGTDADKIMLGAPRGSPIALAAVGDLLGLEITEGIEDALSVHEGTGLGVWAAGSASFLPALADAIPSYVEFVTIVSDPDADGQRFASELKAGLARRRIAHRMLVWGNGERIAA